MKKEIFRWVDGENIHEYRFTDGVCDGFFSNNKEKDSVDKGKLITDIWRKNLPEAGFKEVNQYTTK